MRLIVLLFSLIVLLSAQNPESSLKDKAISTLKIDEGNLVYLDSIRYISKKDLLAIHFNFNAPLKQSQLPKPSEKYFSITDIAPIKPIKKTPPILLKNLYVFSEKNTLFIAPDMASPLDVNFKLSDDKKTLIFQFSPMLKTPSMISNTQYIIATLILILAFLVLFFIKRKIKSSFTSPLTFQKYFIDSKSFVLELNMRGTSYFILSTPRGQVLLDSQSKAALNDLLSSIDKKQDTLHADFPKKTNEHEDNQSKLLEKLKLKPHKNFYTSPNISKELDKNTANTPKQESPKSQATFNEILIPITQPQAKSIKTHMQASLKQEEISPLNAQSTTPSSDLESVFPSKEMHLKQDKLQTMPSPMPITPKSPTPASKPQLKTPNTQKIKSSITGPQKPIQESSKQAFPTVTFLKDEDYENDEEYENDATLNDFFSQVHEPTIKDRFSSALKGILKPFKKNEKK